MGVRWGGLLKVQVLLSKCSLSAHYLCVRREQAFRVAFVLQVVELTSRHRFVLLRPNMEHQGLGCLLSAGAPSCVNLTGKTREVAPFANARHPPPPPPPHSPSNTPAPNCLWLPIENTCGKGSGGVGERPLLSVRKNVR